MLGALTLTPNALARLLRPFGIRSKKLRVGDSTPNGYELEHFQDAFGRYLPPAAERTGSTRTPEQVNDDKRLRDEATGTRGCDVPVEASPNPLD
jgi:hypothetical protein